MSCSKRVISSLCLLHVFLTQAEAEGLCEVDISNTSWIECVGNNISDFNSAFEPVKGKFGPAPSLIVRNTSLKTLHSNTIDTKFIWLFMYENEKLSDIYSSGFASSISSATRLIISGSPLLGERVWKFAATMFAIKELRLFNIGLTSIPENAFRELKSLREINLSKNSITRFEASLAGLKLECLDLSDNQLSDDSFVDNVFENVKIAKLQLFDNPNLTQLNEANFKELLDNQTVVHVGSSSGHQKVMKCVGAEWICAKKDGGTYKYEGQVIDYGCVDKPNHKSIFDYCASWKPRK